MQITNIHNLDESIYNNLSRVYPPKPNRYSITDLVNQPLMRKLKEDHWDELSQDASTMLWMLLGNSVHYILDKGSPLDSFSEEKLTTEIGDATIVGKVDLYHNEIVKDYKVTSVWGFLLGDNPGWSVQLNLYGWLYQLHSFPVKGLEILAILRDWQESKVEGDYPKIPFMVKKIPMWPMKQADEYVVDWLGKIKNPPICSDEDRWMKPTTYAVKKENRKRALRVLPSEQEAQEWMDRLDKTKTYIEVRQGEYTRCKKYCLVKDVCPYNPYKLAQ